MSDPCVYAVCWAPTIGRIGLLDIVHERLRRHPSWQAVESWGSRVV